MVAGLAFLATAVATVFAQATGVRFARTRAAHQGAWTVALSMYALASAALATGESTGWDAGTYRAFYCFGAVLNVPWLALGTVSLLGGRRAARAVAAALLVCTGFAVGVMVTTPLREPVEAAAGIPEGRDHFDALPRALAGVGSGVGAVVVLGGAVWSAMRARRRRDGAARLVVANLLIATGVVANSSGGLLHGFVGHDEAFAVALVTGILVIYAGFLVAASSPSERRSSLPAKLRGSASTNSTRLGSL